MQLVANVSLCEDMLNLTNEGTSTVPILLHLKAFAAALPVLHAGTSTTVGKWCIPCLTPPSSCSCTKFSALHTTQREGHCWEWEEGLCLTSLRSSVLQQWPAHLGWLLQLCPELCQLGLELPQVVLSGLHGAACHRAAVNCTVARLCGSAGVAGPPCSSESCSFQTQSP